MRTKPCGCFKFPSFVFKYPFTVFLVSRAYAVICILLTLPICYLAVNKAGKEVYLVAIADLIALLFILVSLWFTVQKFFYVKLDATLTSVSLIFIIGGLICACSMVQKSDTNHIFYIIVCHLYLIITQFFSVGWSLICTRNAVSRLFIKDWGKSTTQNEVELLEQDF